jgi:hypothetical protein
VFDPKNRIHWVGAIIIAIILILILGVASTATGQTPEVRVTPNPDAGPSSVDLPAGRLHPPHQPR